jgi:hypothetical protein
VLRIGEVLESTYDLRSPDQILLVSWGIRYVFPMKEIEITPGGGMIYRAIAAAGLPT